MFFSTLKRLTLAFCLMFYLHLFTSTDHGSLVSAENKGPPPPAPIASINVSTPVSVTLTCKMPPDYTFEKNENKFFQIDFTFDYDDGVKDDVFATFIKYYDNSRGNIMRSFETNLDDNKYIASVEKVKVDKPTIFSIVVTPIKKNSVLNFTAMLNLTNNGL